MENPDKPQKSALEEKKGVEQPAPINPALAMVRNRRLRGVDDYLTGIMAGDRIVLGQAITLIESRRADHRELAQQIVERCLPHANRSVRVGITGTPGVGKSTFIEALGMHVTGLGKKVAVLAIDPSSQISKGSILGDKTRMERLSQEQQAFIRPSPAGDSLGGVARKTRESIILCEAAGYEVVLVETVGVGQSETAVHSMTDFFLLLLLPGAGDELQGIKRGIVELADLIAVNKADEGRIQLAKQAMQAYKNALHLLPPKESRWIARSVTCSALSGQGLADIWEIIEAYVIQTRENGWFEHHRHLQARYWFQETIDALLREDFYGHPAVRASLESLELAVVQGAVSSFGAAEQLMRRYKGKDVDPPRHSNPV